jgi:hypothetical protein
MSILTDKVGSKVFTEALFQRDKPFSAPMGDSLRLKEGRAKLNSLQGFQIFLIRGLNS